MTKRKPIEHEELLKRVRYNKETGMFYSKLTGLRIGSFDQINSGHRCLVIDGKKYQEARVAVFYVTGQWPKGYVKNRSKFKSVVTKFKDLEFKLPCEIDLERPDINAAIHDSYYQLHKPTIFQRIFGWLNG